MAEARLDWARMEPNPASRDVQYARAREELARFLSKNSSSPQAARARLELARVVSLQGDAQLSQARRQAAPAARRALEASARELLQEAVKQFCEAVAALEKQLTNDGSPTERAALARARIEAQLAIGLALFQEMKTYDDSNEVLKRGQVGNRAIEAFQKVAPGELKDPLYWDTRAWLGRCYLELDSPANARKVLAEVTSSTLPAAQNGKRLARYFRILLLDKEPDVKDPLTLKAKLAEEWLQAYPTALNTPEGFGVRFHLAEAYLGQALKRPKSQHHLPEVQQLFARTERLYEDLERTDNDFASTAHERKLNVIIMRSGERSGGDISKLRDFQECYLRAQVEIAFMADEEKKLPLNADAALRKKHEQERQRRLENLVAALTSALDLADAQTPHADLVEARYILAYAYLLKDEPYRAAILGEELAHREPGSTRASSAGGYALEAYAKIIGEEQRVGAPAGELDADRRRLRLLAKYMEQTWPTDSATDLARQELGLLAFHEKKYPEAVAIWSKIGAGYGGYALAEYQLANAALQTHKEGAKAPGGGSYQDIALAALRRVPEPGPGAEPAAVQVYLYAKLELAKLLFAARDYAQMEAVTDQVTKLYNDLKLPEATKNELGPTVAALPYYARYGQAETEFRAGRFNAVRKLVDPVVDLVVEGKLSDLKDPQLLRGLLGLALRANVREGDSKRAKAILGLLLQKTGSDLENSASVLAELVQQLRSQVEELRKQGPAAQAELEKTIASFAAFLDELAKQPPEALTPDLVRFLAFAYAGLDRHRQAADLLARISPAPMPGDGDKEATYHGLRLLYARELRLAKDFATAGEVLKDIQATDWGKKNADAKKERIYLLEDEGKFAAAARAWTELMNTVLPAVDKNARLKDLYFEAYYHLTWCRYQAALLVREEGKRREGIRRAAGLIVRLESSRPDMGGEGLKKRYDALLKKEAPLREQYDDLKKGSR
jgi:hypothetical protein